MKEENTESITVHGAIRYNWVEEENKVHDIEKEAESDWELFVEEVLRGLKT